MSTKQRLKIYRERYKKRHKARWAFFRKCRKLKYRANKMCADTGKVTKEFLMNLYNYRFCYYCKKQTPKKKRTADHIVPLVSGGKHDPKNLVMACLRCNCSKQGFDLETFLKKRGFK